MRTCILCHAQLHTTHVMPMSPQLQHDNTCQSQQLVHITGLPYSYGDFIKMETDVLNSLKWEVQYISVYDVLTHFIC